MSVIQNIGTEQAPLTTNRVSKQPEVSSQQARAVSSVTSNVSHEFVVSLSNEAVDVANIQKAKNSLNDTAKNIRQADQAMQMINEVYIEQMKASLNAIRKQYPPFPPGSEERISYLRSFNAFRKMIDQLSFNTVDNGAATVLAGTSDKISESIDTSAANNS